MKKIFLITILSGAALLFSCNANKTESEATAEASDSVTTNYSANDSVKLVKSATIDFKVKDVYNSANALKKAVAEQRGLVTNQTIDSYEDGSKTLQVSNDSMQVITSYVTKANMLVRVPAENLDHFLEQVSVNADYIKSLNVLVEDKSFQYLSSRLKQQNRDRLYENELNKKHKTGEAIDLIGQKDQAIDNLVSNRQINRDVQYSTIELSFYQDAAIRKEIVANTDLSYYQLPFSRSMSDAFANGWNYFLRIVIAIMNLWVFILVGVGVWVWYRYYRVRKISGV
ncbi:DUF4349 domain-containing protein [Pedobacter sp. HMF7647]|uniref:DUF4349 domain-containing protein n=1 Tax=Hufsiella arboris TaxID=2695275 RepID=A0A7K1Y5Q0_9SPHI|nr:DUF4349 domain-containing protein [Hufsiella arboris]MXV49905.1 DUF4349 domain-containing protein [Hufsiella arboris]